jgi:rod shape-determining protein MreC
MTYKQVFVLRLAVLWVLLEAFAAWQVRTPDGARLLTGWMRALARPVVATADAAVTTAEAFATGVRDYRQVMADNRRMRRQLESLIARQQLLEEDLEALRDASLLGGPNAEYAAGAIVARCIFRDVSAGTMEVRTADSVAVTRDTPVVTRDGIVGRITHSEGRRHWIQLITHAAAAAAVRTDDRRLEGLVVGSGSPSLSVAYVPRQADLERGTVLITSGGDGIFPPGIPVAWVVAVRETEGPFLEIAASPTAELDATRVVLLLPRWSAGEAPP